MGRGIKHNNLLARIRRFSHDQFSNQYRLNARLQLYAYCEKKDSLQEWIFEHLDFSNVDSVLDIGCGTGIFWKINEKKIPPAVHIVLSDISPGMVDAAKESLGRSPYAFEFQVFDAHRIPHPDASFRIVIANHMLYLVEYRDVVFSEMSRVLARNGCAFASTMSANNLCEIGDIAAGIDPRFDVYRSTASKFNLENGERLLSERFTVIDKFVFKNDIQVSQSEPALLYLASEYSDEVLSDFIDKIEIIKDAFDSIIEKNGKLVITNSNALFQCVNK